MEVRTGRRSELAPEPPDKRLDRPPELQTFTIRRLVEQVEEGRIRIPRLLRALRWEREDVRLLLDSVYKGYPIGTLLFWRRAADAESLAIGPLPVDAPAMSDALLVVDGQQRLTALAGALLAPTEPHHDFSLYFDLERQALVGPPAGRPPPTWLPLGEALDAVRLLQWVLKRGEGLAPRLRQVAIDVGRRIREYTVPAYVVDSDDEDVVRAIFERTHSGGRPMEREDVFDALHGTRTADWPRSPGDIEAGLDAHGFGTIDERLVRRSLLAIQGPDGVRDPRVSAPDALAWTARALDDVVVFLRRDAGIPHVGLVPYQALIIPLARFFHLHRTPSARSRELLARWLWRGSINGRHHGVAAATRPLLEAIDEHEEASVQRLLEKVGGRPASSEAANEKFSLRHARARLQVLALLSLGPRDLASGEPLDAVSLALRHPRGWEAVVRPILSRVPRREERAQGVANRIVHPTAVGGGLAARIATVGDPDILASHAIPIDAARALADRDFAGFLRLRAAAFDEVFEAWRERHARWDEPARPSIDALIVPDDE